MCSQWIYNYKPEQIESHTHKQQQQQQQQLKLAYSTLWVNGNKIPQWMSADVFDTNSHFPICCLIGHDEWWKSGRRCDKWQHLGSTAWPIDSPSLLPLQPSWLLCPIRAHSHTHTHIWACTNTHTHTTHTHACSAPRETNKHVHAAMCSVTTHTHTTRATHAHLEIHRAKEGNKRQQEKDAK